VTKCCSRSGDVGREEGSKRKLMAEGGGLAAHYGEQGALNWTNEAARGLRPAAGSQTRESAPVRRQIVDPRPQASRIYVA